MRVRVLRSAAVDDFVLCVVGDGRIEERYGPEGAVDQIGWVVDEVLCYGTISFASYNAKKDSYLTYPKLFSQLVRQWMKFRDLR